MKLLLIGSNPSNASVNNNPFDGSTKSCKILSHWISSIQGWTEIQLINVSDTKTPKNRPLKKSEIDESLPSLEKKISKYNPDKIVTLGKTASKALTLLCLPFFELPHPSGMNRQLNDPEFIENKIKELQLYVKKKEDK